MADRLARPCDPGRSGSEFLALVLRRQPCAVPRIWTGLAIEEVLRNEKAVAHSEGSRLLYFPWGIVALGTRASRLFCHGPKWVHPGFSWVRSDRKAPLNGGKRQRGPIGPTLASSLIAREKRVAPLIQKHFSPPHLPHCRLGR